MEISTRTKGPITRHLPIPMCTTPVTDGCGWHRPGFGAGDPIPISVFAVLLALAGIEASTGPGMVGADTVAGTLAAIVPATVAIGVRAAITLVTAVVRLAVIVGALAVPLTRSAAIAVARLVAAIAGALVVPRMLSAATAAVPGADSTGALAAARVAAVSAVMVVLVVVTAADIADSFCKTPHPPCAAPR